MKKLRSLQGGGVKKLGVGGGGAVVGVQFLQKKQKKKEAKI